MKQKILDTAVSLARSRGYQYVYKHDIARLLGCSEATVNYHWDTMVKLRNAVIINAIETRDLTILAQSICLQHALAKKIPAELRAEALRSLK